jgi:hypothetical protein
MSLDDIMFPLNTFYCNQDTVWMLSIYLIVCVHNFYFIIIIVTCQVFLGNMIYAPYCISIVT